MTHFSKKTLFASSLILFGTAAVAQNAKKGQPAPQRNIIFILSDDHRFDYMGFTQKVPWLETPVMDSIAHNGVHLKNAFVSTALSSPSRASILTGMYAHQHQVVDNETPVTRPLTYFPEYLQQNGYQTAFFGKWHMGNSGDEKQKGFDHWESFKGQGDYYNFTLNINGDRKSYGDSLYIANVLTDHTIEWIEGNKDKPFFVYLSHKSVHDNFSAARKDIGKYKNEEINYPPSYPYKGSTPLLPSQKEGKPLSEIDWYGTDMVPDWVKSQRESWHGVDYSYHGRRSFEEECRKYCETLTSLDSSIGELMKYLKEAGLDKSTLIVYMGDNGFCWGEHGLIDKRNAYEQSMRVPMLAYCPDLIQPGTVVDEMVMNVDIAPTFLEVAGISQKPEQIEGSSFLPLLKKEKIADWREKIFYEYYWEYDFPHTPTTFAIRTDRYKYIRYHGIWDTNEFYDLENDPDEMHNLINSVEHRPMIKQMAADIFGWLEKTGGMQIPLKPTIKKREGDHRNPNSF